MAHPDHRPDIDAAPEGLRSGVHSSYGAARGSHVCPLLRSFSFGLAELWPGDMLEAFTGRADAELSGKRRRRA